MKNLHKNGKSGFFVALYWNFLVVLEGKIGFGRGCGLLNGHNKRFLEGKFNFEILVLADGTKF